MIRYYNYKQRSKQWYIMRLGRWTGSTAIDLLRGKKTPPNTDNVYDNKHMLRGRVLEPLAIEAYEHATGNRVSQFGFITNSKYKHAGYSPDGIEPDTIDEVKCVNVEKHMAIGTGKIPIPTEWISQTHFGIVVTELHKIRLILYNPDAETPLFYLYIPIQQAILDNIIAKLKATEPKRKPSQMRAKQKYDANNSTKIKEYNHKYYLKNKK